MLAETRFHRQLDLLPPSKTQTSVTIIGSGGIGSITSLILAKIGFGNLTIFDGDAVESHNLPSQFFSPGQVGDNKAEAISQTIFEFTGERPLHYANEWTQVSSPIVVSCVDSMKTRKEIYDHLKTQYGVELYVEARMSAESMRIYTLQPSNPDHQKFYEANLYSDEEASEEVCTAKAIAYNTFIIGGIIGSILKKFAMNQPYPKELIFDLKTYGLICLKHSRQLQD